MKTKRTLIPLLILFAILFLSGCSFVRIQNIADSTVTVRVRVPDSGKSYTRTIRSGMIVDVFSSHGGRYTIEQINSERYIKFLNDMQANISQRLFAERQTMSAAHVTLLVEQLNEIDALLAQSSDILSSCSGTVPDFDTVVATIAFDPTSQTYHSNCGSAVE